MRQRLAQHEGRRLRVRGRVESYKEFGVLHHRLLLEQVTDCAGEPIADAAYDCHMWLIIPNARLPREPRLGDILAMTGVVIYYRTARGRGNFRIDDPVEIKNISQARRDKRGRQRRRNNYTLRVARRAWIDD